MKEHWWERESAWLATVWLITLIGTVAHFTHTGASVSKPVNWWIVGVWVLVSLIATFHYVQSKRRKTRQEKDNAE
jgi:general stress protein CsbA